jgi:hypothetical protein
MPTMRQECNDFAAVWVYLQPGAISALISPTHAVLYIFV